jgi:hypothetical protein
VKDPDGAGASVTFDLTVEHVNHAPYNQKIRSPADGAKFKEGTEISLDGTAKDRDAGDSLEYNWLDNGFPLGQGGNISAKLKPGKHLIVLEVTDGTETVRTEINLEVTKKAEKVTVQDNGWMVGAAAAVVACLAVVGAVAVLRRRRTGAAALEGGAQAAAIGASAGLAQGPPPEEEAKKVMDWTVERMADYQEAHPEEALDMSPVLENLDLAREFLDNGDGADALQYAREAEAAVRKVTHMPEPGPPPAEVAAAPSPATTPQQPDSVPPPAAAPQGPAPVLPTPATPQGPDAGAEARKIMDSTVDRMSDYQDAHPEEALDMSPVMENLDLARELLKSGDGKKALSYARMAETAVMEMTHAGGAPAGGDAAGAVGKLECPGCGEELQPEWTVCPVCGHQTR